MLYITEQEITKVMPVNKDFTEGTLAFTIPAEETADIVYILHAKKETIAPSTGTLPVLIENSLYKRVDKSTTGVPYKPQNDIRDFTRKLRYNYKEKSGIRAFA